MPPPQAQNLLRIARLKLAARRLGIRRLDFGPQGGYLIFEEKNSIDPAAVIRMLQKSPREYRLDGPLKLRVSRPMEKEDARFEFAADLLKRLETATPVPATPAAKGPAPAPVAAAKPAKSSGGKRH
jgi:transcription-repair coupling factor (superfamily II helicase)